MWLQGAEIIFILEDATVFLTQAGNAFKPAIREAMSKKNSGLRLTLLWQFTQVSIWGPTINPLCQETAGLGCRQGQERWEALPLPEPSQGGWSRSPPALEVGEIVVKRSPW